VVVAVATIGYPGPDPVAVSVDFMLHPTPISNPNPK
jgi:hypothetical protein